MSKTVSSGTRIRKKVVNVLIHITCHTGIYLGVADRMGCAYQFSCRKRFLCNHISPEKLYF